MRLGTRLRFGARRGLGGHVLGPAFRCFDQTAVAAKVQDVWLRGVAALIRSALTRVMILTGWAFAILVAVALLTVVAIAAVTVAVVTGLLARLVAALIPVLIALPLLALLTLALIAFGLTVAVLAFLLFAPLVDLALGFGQ